MFCSESFSLEQSYRLHNHGLFKRDTRLGMFWLGSPINLTDLNSAWVVVVCGKLQLGCTNEKMYFALRSEK